VTAYDHDEDDIYCQEMQT